MTNRVIRFQITIPTDHGFIGRSCSNADCVRYFKVRLDSLGPHMFCPYCGDRFTRDELRTRDQDKYFTEASKEQALKVMYDEVDKVFGQLARKSSRTEGVIFEHKPIRYRPKPVNPRYQEREVDTELVCPDCGFVFQVFGIFGYCPGCRSENLLIYDADISIIRREMSASPDPQRHLRHAYSDLVSAFESFCERKARSITPERERFQMLFKTRKFFKKHLGTDILEGLTSDQLLALRRVFQKRHLYQHHRGVINDRYVRLIPEDSELIGQQAELSLEEFNSASQLFRRVLDNLVNALQQR